MKTKLNVVVLVVAALLAGAPVAQAAAPKSLVGTWKVESLTINGKAAAGISIYARGALWKLKKDGTATIAAFSDAKWTYDAADGELVTTRTGIFGIREKLVFSVTSQGNDIKFKFQSLLSNWEVVLTPD